MSVISAKDNHDNTTTVEVICDFHSPAISEEMVVPTLGFYNWMVRRMHVQHAFPDMSVQDREKLITGMCAKCEADIFGGSEE
jgi:hypothetical protein